MDFTLALLKNYKEFILPIVQNLRNLSCWKNPPRGYLKLNVGTVLFYSNNKIGLGQIVREETGGTGGAGSMLVQGICEPKIIELLAILIGLQMAASLGIRKVILDCDCFHMI